MGKKIKCDICGAFIDTETGKTFFERNSDAQTMDELLKENAKLKAELKGKSEKNESEKSDDFWGEEGNGERETEE